MFIPDRTSWLVVAVILVATFIRSAFGFGEALVAVPLLALLMPVEVAAPIAVLVSITVATIVIVQDWRRIHVRSAGLLLATTLLGTPIGLLMLTHVSGSIVKRILGVVIVAFSIYSLMKRNSHIHLKNDRLAWLFGFVAGILGGAYGMNGPPLVVYGSLRRWSPQHFRATLQGYFLPASIVVMLGYWLAGLWIGTVTRYYLISLPVVILGTMIGRFANHRMSGRSFFLYVYLGLIVIGSALVLRSLSR